MAVQNGLTPDQQQVLDELFQMIGPPIQAAWQTVAPQVQQLLLDGYTADQIFAAVGQKYRQAVNQASPTTSVAGSNPSGPGPAQPDPAAPPSSTSDQQSALADLTAILDQYGLGDMAQWAWGELTAGKSEAQVVLDLYQTQEFQQRFPGIQQRQQAGLPPISPGDYVNYEDSAAQILRAEGIDPTSAWARQEITGAIGSDVSLNELQQRAHMASQAAFQMPQAVRDTLQRDYGVAAGDIARMFLDTTTPEPQLAQEFMAAQIGGAGALAGYQTNRQVDERLAADGVTFGQAQQGFTDLGLKRQLFSALPGEQGFQGISQSEQLGAEFEGNADAQRAIDMEAKRRVAQFSGAGSFATSSTGISGLGVAQ
jgi:hypothetical protein